MHNARRVCFLATALPTLVGSSSAVGCNWIAGIKEGALIGASGGDEVLAPAENGDASTGALFDATAPLTPDGADATDDAYDSAAPIVPVGCALAPGSPFVVDALSTTDGGSYRPGVWLIPGAAPSEVYVVAQRASDDNVFLAYDVNLALSSANGIAFGGWENAGGVQLLDVSDNGNVALATYADQSAKSGRAYGLQVVPLPAANNSFGSPFPISASQFAGTGFTGTICPLSASSAAYVVGYLVNGGGPNEAVLLAGTGSIDDAGGSFVTLDPTYGDSTYTASGASIVHTPGSFEMFLGGMTVASTAYSIPDDFSAPGAKTLLPDPAGSFIAAAMPAGDAGIVAVGLASEPAQTALQTWTATVPPAGVGALAVGSPPFTLGGTVDLGLAPMTQTGRSWIDGELALVGVPGAGSGLALLWLAPDARPVFAGLVISTPNAIEASAVLFKGHIGEQFANVALAWTEHVVADGGFTYDRIVAAQLLCQAQTDAGF